MSQEKLDVLRIALPVPLNKLFDYKANANDRTYYPGSRVRVNFNRRALVGVIVEVTDKSPFGIDRLKPIDELIDETPLLNHHLMDLAKRSHRYYHHPLGEVLTTILPLKLTQGHPASISPPVRYSSGPLIPEANTVPHRRQAQLIELLNTYPVLSREQIPKTIPSNTIQSLLKKQWMIKVTPSAPKHVAPPPLTAGSPLTLNREQHDAVNTICNHGDAFGVFLLHGVTGSGKTEVYLRIIEKTLTLGRQVLVLVPEIGLTPQTISRFSRRFNVPIYTFHSDMTAKEQLESWVLGSGQQPCIIIGTRSAMFMPLPDLGLIVVDEEHDTSFKQQDGFRYSARDLSVMRAKLLDIPIILGSATPTLDSLHNCQKSHYTLLTLKERATQSLLPQIKRVDIKRAVLKQGLSEAVLSATEEHLNAGSQVLFFINRRGFAPVLICHDCAWTANCTQCDAKMTLHLHPPALHCHHCEWRAPIPQHCPDCGSHQLIHLGSGTEKVEDSLKQFFPNFPVMRIDRDNVRKKGQFDQALDTINEGKPLIIVGTQMMAKGHHFSNLTLVVILNIDMALFAGDFRASEKAIQLIAQVTGRAGRESRPGMAMIQTHDPDHPLMLHIAQNNLDAAYQFIRKERMLNDYPPYSRQILLRAESEHANIALQFLTRIKQSASSERQKVVNYIGPMAAPLSKRAGRYRMNLLLQSASRNSLHQEIKAILQLPLLGVSHKQLRWSIDVDPQDLF